MANNINQKEYLKKYLSATKKNNKLLSLNVLDEYLFCSGHLEDNQTKSICKHLSEDDRPQLINLVDETSKKFKRLNSNEIKINTNYDINKHNNIKKERKYLDLSPPRKHLQKIEDYSPVRSNINQSVKKFGLQQQEVLRNKSVEQISLKPKFSGNVNEPFVRTNRNKCVQNKVKFMEFDKREIDESYNKWSKGLHQIEMQTNKIKDDFNEINKPVARYVNDVDLDELLKTRQRSGDPMLSYMSKNKRKLITEITIPIYKGYFSENRFNIRPGYRWDGLDRSNGYEIKYFKIQSGKTAILDDAYRYSTEEM